MTEGLQAVRLLRALGAAEEMSSTGRAVDPAYALAVAARRHAVPEESLARVWLVKAVRCSQARVLMTSMSQADIALDEEIR